MLLPERKDSNLEIFCKATVEKLESFGKLKEPQLRLSVLYGRVWSTTSVLHLFGWLVMLDLETILFVEALVWQINAYLPPILNLSSPCENIQHERIEKMCPFGQTTKHRQVFRIVEGNTMYVAIVDTSLNSTVAAT